MAQKHKFKRDNRNRDNTARNDRRRGRKQAARDAAFSTMRDAKAAGEERFEEDLIDPREVHEALYDAQRPIEIRAREVQIGNTPKHSFARTVDGKTTVKSEFLRKPKGQSWTDYKANVASQLATSNMVEAKLRVSRRDAASAYLAELTELLTEKLHLRIFKSRTIGTAGQGQRTRQLRRWQRDFCEPRACFIVTDAGPAVVMATRYVVLDGSYEQLEHWGALFGPERQDVLLRYDDERLALAAARLRVMDEALAEPPVIEGEFQSFPTAPAEAFAAFAQLAGSRVLTDATAFLEAHWPMLVVLSSELVALSTVRQKQRVTYLTARVTSEAFRDLSKIAGVKAFLMELVLHKTVVNFAQACADSCKGPPDMKGDFQGFADFVSTGFSAAITPGTAVNGLMVLGSAAAVLLQAREDSHISLSHASQVLFKQAARVPACNTPQAAVTVILQYLPGVMAAVLSAARVGSLSGFLTGGDSVIMRFARVQAGYELHKQGLYPNTEYTDAEAFMRDVEECYDELAPLARRGEPSAVRVWAEATSMRTALRNDIMGLLRPAPFSLAIVGESGVGKSGVLSFCRDFLTQEHFGRATPPDRIHTIQCTDQYASGYKMSHEVIVLDDVFNAKAGPGVSVSNPTAPIIEIVNNITTPLNMADLDSKGKIAYRSPFFFVTSNVDSLGSVHYSNEPVSVLRRFNLFIEPTVREQYRLQGTVMLDPRKVPDPALVPVPDLWQFRLWTVYKHPTDVASPLRKAMVHFPPENTILDLIELLKGSMKQHFAAQTAFCEGHKSKPHLKLSMQELRERLAPVLSGGLAHPESVAGPPLPRGVHQMYQPGGAQPAMPSVGEVVEPRLADARYSRLQRFVPVWPGYGATATIWDSLFGALPFAEARGAVWARLQRVAWDAFVYVGRLWLWSVCNSVIEDFFNPISTFFFTIVLFNSGWVALGFYLIMMPILRVGARASWATFAPRRGPPQLPDNRLPVAVAAAALVVWLLLRPRTQHAQFQGLTEFAKGSSEETATVHPVDVPEAVTTCRYDHVLAIAEERARFVLMESGSAVAPGVFFPVRSNIYATNAHILAPLLASDAREIRVLMAFRTSKRPQAFTISKSYVWQPNQTHDLVFVFIPGPPEKDLTAMVMPDKVYEQMLCYGANLQLANAGVAVLRADATVYNGQCRDLTKALIVHKFGVQGPPKCQRVAFQHKEYTCLAMKLLHGATQSGDCGSPLVLSLRADRGDVSFVGGLLSGVSHYGGGATNLFAPILSSYVDGAVQHFARATFQGSLTTVTPLVMRVGEESETPRGPPPSSLFGQDPGLTLATARRHKDLPDTQGLYVKAIGVLVDKSGANRVSENTFTSSISRGLFFKDPEVDAVLGFCAHKLPTEVKGGTRNVEHFVRPLDAMSKKRDDFDEAIVRTAVADFEASLRICFASTSLPSRPATIFEAANTDGVQSRFNLSTAAGFGHSGTKRQYFARACERGCKIEGCPRYHPGVEEYVRPRSEDWYPGPEILREISEMVDRLASGERDLAIFKASLKDEVIGRDKEKIRAFYVGTIALNIVVRMYLMPFMSRLQGVAGYECAVGINVLSHSWEEMQVELEQFGSSKRLAGDYSGFDLSTHPRLLEGFYDTLAAMARDARWSDRDLAVVRGLRNNLSHPIYIVLGQVYQVDGSNPSGVSITTHTNSGVNSLIHRYAFYAGNPTFVGRPVLHNAGQTRFTSVVTLKTYGDDVIGAVHDETLGVAAPYRVITNADVAQAATRFGMVYGPCDKGAAELPTYYDSGAVQFLKCDSVYVPEAQFRVGRISLSSIRKSLAFESNSDLGSRISTMQSALWLYFPHAACVGGTGRQGYDTLRSIFVRKLAALNSVQAELLDDSCLPTYDDVLARITAVAPQGMPDVMSGEFHSKQCRNNGSNGINYFKLDMATNVQESVVTNVEHDVSRALTGFFETAEAPSVGHADGGQMPVVHDSSSVGRFLERPVRVATVQWNVGDHLFLTLDPWSLFLSDAAVKERVSYFARLRGDLVVRVVVNGTPMHYGSARLCYRPHPLLGSFDDPVFNHAVSLDSSAHEANYRLVMSQLSGFDINPCYFANGELRLPYMSPLPGLDLVAGIYGTMGTLHLHSFTTLQHANDGINPVTMELYVHMEGAVLDVPTAVHQGYTLQDAREVVRRVLRAGAKATAVAHEWTPRVLTAAAMLGFSRPLEHDLPISMRNIPFALANYDAPDTAECLALSSTTEHTLGGQELGTTGEDELVLARLAARPGLVNIGHWDSEQTRGAFVLGSVVNPMQALVSDYTMTRGIITYPTVSQSCLTPCGFSCAPARFWHATLVYKFTVVCSPYHKGRLRVYFEPDPSTFPASPPMNLTNSAILDLAEASTLTVEVPWQNARDMLPVGSMWNTNTHTSSGVFELRCDSEDTTTCNGIIVCEVLSPLTGLVATSAVKVLVEVSAKDLVLYGVVAPGSGGSNVLATDAGAIPYVPQAFDLTGGDAIASLRQLLKRYVLQHTVTIISDTSAAETLTTHQVQLPVAFPVAGYPVRSLEAYSLDVSAVGDSVNYTQMAFYTYVSQAFAMVRGAIRWKVSLVQNFGSRPGQPTMVERSVGPILPRAGRRTLTRTYSGVAGDVSFRARAYMVNRIRRAATGAQLAGFAANSGANSGGGHLDVEFPFEGYVRAGNPRCPMGYVSLPAQGEGLGSHNALLTVELGPNGTGTTNSYAAVDIYTAVGEDYNLFGFVHAPAFLNGIPLRIPPV